MAVLVVALELRLNALVRIVEDQMVAAARHRIPALGAKFARAKAHQRSLTRQDPRRSVVLVVHATEHDRPVRRAVEP